MTDPFCISFAHFMAHKSDYTLIDIRESEEIETHPFVGTPVAWMPMSRFQPWHVPSQQPVLLSCHTDRRSRALAYQLREEEFDNVFYLQGGYVVWQQWLSEAG
jgi:rhodanese-related sulfurtransferase